MPMNNLVKIIGISTGAVLSIGLYFWLIPWLFSQDNLLSVATALILALTPVAAAALLIFKQIFSATKE